MSPAGFSTTNTSDAWAVHEDGLFKNRGVILKIKLRPVINLESNIQATGTGTSTDPFIIQS